MNETGHIKTMTISQKLAWLEERYWRFGQDEMLIDHLEDLFGVDDEGNMTCEPRHDPLTGETKGLMVLGGAGQGKTAQLKRLLRTNAVLTKFKYVDDLPSGNTLYVTVPPEASLKKLAEIILDLTGYDDIHPKLRAADAWEIGLHRFSVVGIKAVIIDECHHMLQPGPGKDVRTAIQSLKHVMQSDHGVALVIAGVPTLRDAIMSEPSRETYRRFAVHQLSKIRPDTYSSRLFASNFQKSAEILGLKMDAADAFAERIQFAEHGEVGGCVALAKEILREAISRKRDELSLEYAERVFRKRNGELGMAPFHSGNWTDAKSELETVGWVQ
jgi:hypothetical protein